MGLRKGSRTSTKMETQTWAQFWLLAVYGGGFVWFDLVRIGLWYSFFPTKRDFFVVPLLHVGLSEGVAADDGEGAVLGPFFSWLLTVETFFYRTSSCLPRSNCRLCTHLC
ncbi:hypothetical protein SUGI_1072070 [Cryptomeria japonica]|nr:hypothetical protein SUGI_1072070 [Cryptomeria japonica]